MVNLIGFKCSPWHRSGDFRSLEISVGISCRLGIQCLCHILFRSEFAIWYVLTLRNTSEREKDCLQVLLKNKGIMWECCLPLSRILPCAVRSRTQFSMACSVLISCCVLLWFHDLISFPLCFLLLGSTDSCLCLCKGVLNVQWYP